ncbi:ATPase domain-containing protein [Novosphingobium terrae]|uniref:ATPase domain-containing protein n=1 Tax=Novosphingobium terrae TaxID=2726189 RepID=UPI00198126B7|nr:ATPase domain-containing protein [Novosphingobium terrae]
MIISTGNSGLDLVLRGGVPAHRVYLLEGAPGSGKTTLALEFLRKGVALGERVLYITLSETREELRVVAASHGWNLEGIDIFELSSADSVFGEGREQSILHPWEMELSETIKLIRDEVERVQPIRVVFDSLSEMRLLAQDPLRYRRQVLALKQFFSGRESTVILVDDMTGNANSRDAHLHSLCHGVITLERLTLDFGAARRRMQVQKLRGVDFIAGFHDLVIRKGGVDIFPRLIAADHHGDYFEDVTPSGIAELDGLLAGGPLRGTSLLLTGPAGSGKTTVALQYVHAACERGEPCTIFEFDERVATLFARAKAFNLDISAHVEQGRLNIQQNDPAEISPGEFAARVRREVEQRGARMIVIDSLNGYLAAMPQEQHLLLQMHELLSYLNQQGVVTLLINPQNGLVGTMSSSLNISYVADAVILLRFFEAQGRIRKAISIIKNRGGSHEDAIREFRIDADGIRVGEPLTAFKGVLTGTPEYMGATKPLMEDRALSQ